MEFNKNKTKRLLLPCLFFGVIYFMCFHDIMPNVSPFKIFSGIGHLWYLPCLFWLFIIQYIIIKNNRIKNKSGVMILVISLLPVFSVLPFPLQINKAFYYLLFFYGGGWFYQHRKCIAEKTSLNNTLILWILFVFLVFVLNLIMEQTRLIEANGYIVEIGIKIVNVYLKICLAWVGITALYQSAVLFCKRRTITPFILNIGVCGYGVYIFHQFILKYLYYQTSIPLLFGAYSLPWVALLISFLISVSLTLLLRKTDLGKKWL